MSVARNWEGAGAVEPTRLGIELYTEVPKYGDGLEKTTLGVGTWRLDGQGFHMLLCEAMAAATLAERTLNFKEDVDRKELYLWVYSIPSVSRQTWHPVITFCPSGYTLQQALHCRSHVVEQSRQLPMLL